MSRTRFLLVQIAVWTFYGVVHYLAVLPAITNDERPAMALANLVRAGTGLAVSSGLSPILRLALGRRRIAIALLCLFLTVVGGFAWTFLDRVVLVTIATLLDVEIPWDRFPRGADLDYFFVLLAWIAAVLGLRIWERERDTRERLMEERVASREAQVRELAARLNPHFLFNSLNTIRSFVAEDSDRARAMITRLSGFLRHALSIDPTVPSRLSDEVEAARAYLRIEEARFEPALDVTVEVDSDAADILVPPLVLQPLVENAVRHGAPGEDGVLHIQLRGWLEGARLRLELGNSGTLRKGPEGVGLDLSRSRLRLMYGDAQRMNMTERDGRVVARIEIDDPRWAEEPGGSR